MAFANQGTVAGTSNQGMNRGSVAGGRGATTSSSYNLDEMKKQVTEQMNDALDDLKEQVDKAREADYDSLEKQYTDSLDSILGDGNKEKIYNDMRDSLSKQINDWYKSVEQVYKKKHAGCQRNRWYSYEYYHTNEDTDTYNRYMKNIPNQINTYLDNYQKQIDKAKSMTDTLATDADITNTDILKYQNELISAKQSVADQYQTAYDNQYKLIQNNYQDYFKNLMGGYGVQNATLFGRRIRPLTRVRRIRPRLRGIRIHCLKIKISLPRVSVKNAGGTKPLQVNVKKAVGMKSPKVKKQVRSLDKQLSRNFRKML